MKTLAQISVQYAPIKAVLDAALQHGGGVFEAETYGAAVHFRQRAYAFRKAYRETAGTAASPYDQLTIRRIDAGETTVRIEPQSLAGTFKPADGVPLTAHKSPDPVEDALLEEALALRKELDL